MSDIVERLRRLERRLELTDRRAAADIAREAAAELTRLRANLAAAQERAGRIKTAAQELIKAVDATADHASWLKHMATLRAALGEPQAQGCSKWGPDFPPSCCTAWEDCVSDGMCHDPNCGAPSQHSSEDSPND